MKTAILLVLSVAALALPSCSTANSMMSGMTPSTPTAGPNQSNMHPMQNPAQM